MDHPLGLMDSLLVALCTGAEAPISRVRAARRVGVQLVTCSAAPATARAVLRRIGRAELADSLIVQGDRALLPGADRLAVQVLPAVLRPERFVDLLSERGVRLSPRELAAGYQAADLAVQGVTDILTADDGNFGGVRARLADVEPFTFLGTGTLACRDGVAALSLAAPAPRGLLLGDERSA